MASLVSITDAGLKLMIPPILLPYLTPILTISRSEMNMNMNMDINMDMSIGDNNDTNYYYSLLIPTGVTPTTTTIIITLTIFLYYWKYHSSMHRRRRRTPLVPRKELPIRPALRILFQPDNGDRMAAASTNTSSSSSMSPSAQVMYPSVSPSSSSQQPQRQRQRRQQRSVMEYDTYRKGYSSSGGSSSSISKDFDSQFAVPCKKQDGKKKELLRMMEEIAQDEPHHDTTPAAPIHTSTTTSSTNHNINEEHNGDDKHEPTTIPNQNQTKPRRQHTTTSTTTTAPPIIDSHLPDSFAPLLSSSQTQFLSDGLTPDLLHSLQLTLQSTLHPNRSHYIPLSNTNINNNNNNNTNNNTNTEPSVRPQLTLSVPKIGCKITAIATIGSDDDDDASSSPSSNKHNTTFDPTHRSTRERSTPIVKRVDVVLNPPLSLGNVAPTLMYVPTLFEDGAGGIDKDDARMMGYGFCRRVGIVAWGWRVWSYVSEYVERVLGILEDGCQIHLGKVRVIPIYKANGKTKEKSMTTTTTLEEELIDPSQWRLTLSFSGHVLLFHALPIPFVNITLPTFLIPQPHALLRHLLSPQPLASATLHHNTITNLPSDQIASVLLEAVDTWSVDLEAVVTPPALSVDLTLSGGVAVAVEVMCGRDGGRDGGGCMGMAESASGDTLESWSVNGGDSISNTGTNHSNANGGVGGVGLRFRRHKVRSVGRHHSAPLPKPFDSNTLVPWKLSLGLSGKITKDRVHVRVSNCTAVHNPHTTSGGSDDAGSKISFSGDVVLCKPDPSILGTDPSIFGNLQRSTASTPNLKQNTGGGGGSSTISGGLAGKSSQSESPSVCNILLFPPSSSSTLPSSTSYRHHHHNHLYHQLLQYDYSFDIHEDTHLSTLSFSMGASHPMLKGGTMITTVAESVYAHGSLMARENALLDPGDVFQKRNILKHLPAVDITAGIQNIFIPEAWEEGGGGSYSDDGRTMCVPGLDGGRVRVRVVGGFDGVKGMGCKSMDVGGGSGSGSVGGSEFQSQGIKSNMSEDPSEEFYVAEGIRVVVDFGVDSLHLHNESLVPEFPELDIFCDQKLYSVLSGSTNGSIALHLRPQIQTSTTPTHLFNTGRNVFNPLEAYEIDFSGSNLTSKITEANATLGHRRIIIPSESTFGISIVESVVDMAFDGHTKCEFHWDFQGLSPILQVTEVGRCPSVTTHEERESVPILISSLRQGRFNLNVSSVGGLTVTQAATGRENREGLYDWKFFNAIVSPDEDSPGHIMKVLHDKRTMYKILQVVRLINSDLEKMLSYVLKQVWRAKEIFDNEGVSDPGKAIPHHKMARLLSLFLCNDDSKVDDFLPIIRRVVAGNGLDVVKTKELIRTHLSIYEKWAPEIDRALGWAEVMLGATDAPKPFVEYDVSPLSELPQHKARFVGIPSAKDVYASILEKRHLPLGKSFSNMVSRIAPYMSFSQIAYILQARPPTDWQPSDLRRLRYVYSVKKKVLDISESYGGLSFLPQSFFVSIFVGEATRASLRAWDDTTRPISSMKMVQQQQTTFHALRQRRVHAPTNHQLGSELYSVAEEFGCSHNLSPAGRVSILGNDTKKEAFANSFRSGRRQKSTSSTSSNNSNEVVGTLELYEVGDSLLGPHDVAILLHAGLTSAMKGSCVVQLNQRMLLDLMASQPRIFAVAVLAELGSAGGQVSPRGLSSALMALLELDQNSFTDFHRLDMHTLLESWLPGLRIPRREDYLAGGRWARQTYYTAIFGVAKNILDDAEVYGAFKGHVQRVRHNLETDAVPTEKEISSCTTSQQQRHDFGDAGDGGGICIDDESSSSSVNTYSSVIDDNSELSNAIQTAKKVIEEADARGYAAVTDLDEPDGKSSECVECISAIELYHDAFHACANVLKLDKLAFQADWFKKFYRRNYDALVVKSIFDNAVEDVDEVRQWLDCLRRGSRTHLLQQQKNRMEEVATSSSNISSFTENGDCNSSMEPGGGSSSCEQDFFANVKAKNEGDVINAIIDAVFFYEEERDSLRKDPLVRLLIANPPGQYNFTIVTAMGVVTEGAQGLELAAALERLEKKRNVKTIRADTGTARSFEYNGSKIEQAIEKAVRLEKNPFGILGYSQGCANGLTAESMLRSGSPLQQHTLTSPGCNLVCRQLLFSAANGSMHGPAMEAKIHRLIVMCEEFFKYQQGYCSRGFTSLVLQTLNDFMDSSPFHKFMCGGGGTFLHDGCEAFWREAQHLPNVPTCVLRGVLEDHTTPESLEMISNLLSKEAGSKLHDSQVHVYDAVGHPVYTQNRNGKILKNCDMGGGVQRTHHWSPLCQEVEFVRTKRDIDQASFLCAKDRHVSPWVDVNARFGIIKYASSPTGEKNKNEGDILSI